MTDNQKTKDKDLADALATAGVLASFIRSTCVEDGLTLSFLNACDSGDYLTWQAVGAALHAYGSPNAKKIWQDWSDTCGTFSYILDETWERFSQKPKKRDSILTLHLEAAEQIARNLLAREGSLKPTRYVRRPTPVEAIRYTRHNVAEAVSFCGERVEEITSSGILHLADGKGTVWYVHYGDWIIRDAHGAMFCCCDKDFRACYQLEE